MQQSALSDSRRAPARGHVLLLAPTVALSCGLSDVALSLLLTMPRVDDWKLLVLPATATMLASLVCYLAVTLFLSTTLKRILHLEYGRVVVAVACGQILALILGRAIVVGDSELIHGEPIARIFALALISLLAVVASYAVLTRDSTRPGAFLPRLLHALPFLLLWTLLYLLAQIYLLQGLFTTSTLWISLVYSSLCALTVWFFIRASQILSTGLSYSLLAVFLVAALGALRPDATLPKASLNPPSNNDLPTIIMSTVDTLRHDYVGSHGGNPSLTPNIDQLAADGVMFETAVSAAPWTLPAVASLMTGVSVSDHGVGIENNRLDSSFKTLAERMRDTGYTTVAIGRNIHLRRANNLSQGFDVYRIFPTRGLKSSLGHHLSSYFTPYSRRLDVSTEELGELAIETIRSIETRSLFLWVHFFDPHFPYTPPHSYLKKLGKAGSVGETFERVSEIRSGLFTPTSIEKDRIRELYAAEVAYVDEVLGGIFRALKEAGLYRRSLVVLTSDHGEEFWEHGGFEHGHSVYEEVIRVPLIFKLPEDLASEVSVGRVRTRVGTERVLQTVLDVCCASKTTQQDRARSLRALWKQPNSAEEQRHASEKVLSSGTHYFEEKAAIYLDNFKYIVGVHSRSEELFDLVDDPLEKRSIAEEMPELVALGRESLEASRRAGKAQRIRFVDTATSPEPLDEQTLEELRSLGYVQ